jgi:hypothetical protein
MAKPWLYALRAIPWATLLAQAPAIAKAADALLSGTRSRKTSAPGVDQLRSLVDRVEALENHDRADAELIKQITEQVGALTTATKVLAARQRWLVLIGLVSLGLSLLALGLVLASR